MTLPVDTHTQTVEHSKFGLLTSVFVKLFCLLLFFAAATPAALAQSLSAPPAARLITTVRPYARSRRVSVTSPNVSSPSITPSLSNANDIERRAFEQTNIAREQNGLPKLEWDEDLHRMARLHSESMARLGFFSHVSPEGLRLRDRARAVGIQHFELLAENIANNLGYDDPGGFAVERWLSSPGHRANVMATGFKAMASGTFVASDGSVFITQVFITR